MCVCCFFASLFQTAEWQRGSGLGFRVSRCLGSRQVVFEPSDSQGFDVRLSDVVASIRGTL